MEYKKLVNLHKPTEPYDAVTKDYVDYVAETLKESLNTIDKRPHIIAVHANYHVRVNFSLLSEEMPYNLNLIVVVDF